MSYINYFNLNRPNKQKLQRSTTALSQFPKVLCFVSKFSDNVIEEVQNKLQDIRNPMAAMMVLLREMDLETDSECGADGAVTPGICGRSVCCSLWWRCPAHECFHAGLNTRIHLSRLYGSSSAVSLICQAVCHMSMTRVLFCRDLLILQKLYLRFGDNVGPQHNLHAKMSLMPGSLG